MKDPYKKMPIRGQKFYNRVAIITFIIVNIICFAFFFNKNTQSDFTDYSNSKEFYYETNNKSVVASEKIKPVEPVVIKNTAVDTISTPTNKVENEVVSVKPVTVVKVSVPVVKKVSIVKVVPAKKVVVKKHKIEIIEMTSIPAVSVSFSKINDDYLALDTFIKENEIIAEAIEVIDSVEITTNDTIIKDSTYYVMETNTIAKNEELIEIKTTITNPNEKIVPIKWNGKKIWTKADTTKKIVADKKIFTQKQDTTKIDLRPKGKWSLYKTEDTENATTQNGSQRETTYGDYKILLPSAPDEEVPNNLEDPGYQTDIPPNQKMKETIYCPPPIFDKWHWQENMLNILLYQQLLE
jgi:hypothetical protein